MPILILGGRGNLGSQLTRIMNRDYEVVSLDRSMLDVLDFPALAEKVRILKPELIINTVAYNAVDKCEDREGFAQAWKLNVELPAVLADLAVEQDAVLVQYSTDYVFSGTESKPSFTEDEIPNPINKYGETKSGGEREVLKRIPEGLKYYLIRTSKLFGPRGMSDNAKPSFFDIMSKLAQDKSELTVVNEELSCFTYTLDLAEATKRLWELEVPFGIYHLVNEEPCTWYSAVQTLFGITKTKIPVRPVRSEDLLRAARRPKFSVLVNSKVKKLRPFKAALQEYLFEKSLEN